MPSKLFLHPGQFYRSKAGELWCCFKVDHAQEEHAKARAIRLIDGRVEYFYMDGRYDTNGNREHCLVSTASPTEAIFG